MVWELNGFSYSDTTIRKDGKVMGQAVVPPRSLRPVEGPTSLAATGHVPLREQEQRGLGVCVFSRPSPGRSATPACARPPELPPAGQRPPDAPQALLLPVSGAAECPGDRQLPGVGFPSLRPLQDTLRRKRGSPLGCGAGRPPWVNRRLRQ